MKTIVSLCRSFYRTASLLGLAVAPFVAVAQTPGTLPVVKVYAVDSLASWTGNPGAFLFLRDATNSSLNVFFSVGGTATNGVDYTAIPSSVLIPAGQRTNVLIISPINLGQTNPATVFLQLLPSPMNSQGYLMGVPSNAVVTIWPTPTNLPPSVNIMTPLNGSVFPPGQDVSVCAGASDRDGYVATVEFFGDGISLGVKTNNPMSATPVNPFCLVWTNPPAGEHVLVAKATDNVGLNALSAPVRFSVGVPPPPIPVVNIYARDPIATEIPPVPPGMGMPQPIDPAVFAVVRSGPTNDPLDVAYGIGGTASNGVDYVTLSGTVTIPAGALAADVVVTPIDDNLVEGTETVILTLKPVACAAIFPPPPGCYVLGPLSSAIAYILDNDSTTNLPPLVKIASPPNNAIFRQPVNIPIFAYAADRDDAVTNVEFFDGTTSLGQGRAINPLWLSNTLPPICLACPPPIANQWLLVWTNAPLGSHVLTAQAADSRGAMGTSAPVNIQVLSSSPPPTNPPPVPVINIAATDPIAIEGTNCWTRCVPTNWVDRSSVTSCLPVSVCGPKNATFVVGRLGNPTNALTVAYDIGGTATNGIDYVALSGSVTIPAGERRAVITVVPLDDGPPDINSTVVLKLQASASVPPDYLLGFRTSAAALIVDGARPLPPTGVLGDRCFHLAAPAPDGAWFHVEFSTDLQSWTALCTNQVVNGSIDFVDPDAPADSLRLYRAVPETNPPQ